MNARTPKALGATNTVFAYNIIKGGGVAARIEGPNAGAVWSGNLLWKAAGAGDLPDVGYTTVDPDLVRGQDGIYRLPGGRPALDSSGQAYMKNRGADQRVVTPVAARVLTVIDVGPQSQPAATAKAVP